MRNQNPTAQRAANSIASFMTKIILNALILFIVAKIMPNIEIKTFGVLAASAFVITALNAFVRPLLIFCTFPINVLTLGLFILVINALLMYLTSKIVDGFYIKDFMSAFWGALIFSAFSVIFAVNNRNVRVNADAGKKDKDSNTTHLL
ncbi:MAG: phage holin family protein [Endomicrobium sp.]|jgi:putative membrane protein|nr:phage holin family protein [Endomicrobium sp.]